MWQKFTERARKAVFYAQEDAQKYRSAQVATEHLLLGLMRETDNDAVRVLDRMGVSSTRIRARIESQLQQGDARPSDYITLSPKAKAVINLAYDEARNLNNNYIGTEHVLLGLIRESDGLAGRILATLGVELEVARRVAMAMQDAEHDRQQQAQPPVSAPDTMSAVAYAERLALLLAGRQRHFLTEMLILNLLSDESTGLRALLTEMGADYPELVRAVEFVVITGLQEPEGSPAPSIGTLFGLAWEQAQKLGNPFVTPAHLLLALLVDGKSPAAACFSEALAVDILQEKLRVAPDAG